MVCSAAQTLLQRACTSSISVSSNVEASAVRPAVLAIFAGIGTWRRDGVVWLWRRG